ncbi:Ig-like domain-containing protein [Alkaliphilus serpentinus]|uniref:SLH domain-containing protein n=1 Tax=Alkaliphilus serpentinus TaxID=1482731 RepID=A0A833M9E9_9FIRM|nr:Ig-like domain-containing protein [Alkaliphilus serpentinus]KAB3529716.1 hypothetical protein F8153_08945 [Alkaliphilus serpentinus]
MKKVLSLVLVLAMVLGTFGFAFAAPTATDIQKLQDYGVLIGDGSGNLMLDQTLTRAQFAVFSTRLTGNTDAEVQALNEAAPFDDVSGYYAPFIGKAYKDGLVNGVGNNKYMPEAEVTYVQALTVLMRALGYGADLEGLAWPSGYYAKAAALGLVDGSIEMNANITRGQMADTILTALATETKDGVVLEAALGYVEELTVVEVVVVDSTNIEVTFNDDVTVAYELTEALEANVETAVLVEYLEEVFEITVVWEVDFLEVVSVSADNLKEVVVEFNQEVDVETVVDANFSLNKEKEAIATLQADGKTVVLTIKTELANQVEYTLTVDKVKNLAGEAIEKTETKFTAFDATLPEIQEVVVTGPRNLELRFSEPIKTAGTVEVKQDKTTLGNKVTVDGTNVVVVETFTNFVDGKDYTVKVTGFVDYATYKNINKTLEFNYVKDVTPPVATITKAEQTYVVVEFNKPVKGIEADMFYHTFTAWEALEVFKTAEFSGADAVTVKATDYVTKVYVQFWESGNTNSKPLPEGNITVGIKGSDIKDHWGNKLGDQTMTVGISVDKTPIEVTEIEVKAEDVLVVKFNKAYDKFEGKNVEVLDEDGKKIDGLTVTIQNKKEKSVELKLSKKQPGEVLTVNIKDVQDTALVASKITLYTQLVEVTDKTKPVAEEVYYDIKFKEVKSGDNVFSNKALFVRFSEAVDADTALEASNYAIVVGNAVTILTEDPSFDGANTRVKLPLTDAQADILYTNADVEANVKLQVINVKDLAGNKIVPKIVDLQTNIQSSQFVKVTSIEATSKDTLVVKFNDLLTGVTSDAFEVNGGNNFTLTQTEDKGVTVLEFVYGSKAFETDKSNVTFEILFGEGIKNSFGTEITSFANDSADYDSQTGTEIVFANSFIADSIAPEIMVYTSGANEDEYIVERVSNTEIEITFSEAIDAAALSSLTFTVENANVSDVDVKIGTDNVVVITFTAKSGKTVPDAPKVTQKVNVVDSDGNTFMADEELPSFDVR